MPGAPWPLGLLFAAALALMISLGGPLLLFNPWLVAALQARHEVPSRLGVSQAEVDRVTGEILVDLYTVGDFDVTLQGDGQLLDERERSHMRDVARLLRVLWAAFGLAAALLVASAVAIRQPRRLGELMVAASAVVGAAAIVVALVFAVAFEPAFLAFHALFFPPGTYLFAEGSRLIALFPEGFWFDASLAAGASIVLTALALGLLGWRLSRPPAA